jgi:hypothetical protein
MMDSAKEKPFHARLRRGRFEGMLRGESIFYGVMLQGEYIVYSETIQSGKYL